METKTNEDPNSRQVAGQHYRDVNPAYQHWDLVAEYDLDYFMGQVTKYVARWRKKNGLQDLEKAQHYLQKLQRIYDVNPRRWCVRQPAVPTHNFYEFCRVQGLSRDETLAMEMCLTFTGPDALERLQLLLQRIEQAARTGFDHSCTCHPKPAGTSPACRVHGFAGL